MAHKLVKMVLCVQNSVLLSKWCAVILTEQLVCCQVGYLSVVLSCWRCGWVMTCELSSLGAALRTV